MIIIWEGLDGSGKTTLQNAISKNLNIPLVKLNIDKKLFNGDIEQYGEVFNRCIVQLKSLNFMLNRSFPGSFVYSKVYNRKHNLKYLGGFEKKLNYNAKIVFLTTNSYKTNIRRRKRDKLIDKSKFKELWEEYENYFCKYNNKNIPMLKINTDKLSIFKSIRLISKFIKE